MSKRIKYEMLLLSLLFVGFVVFMPKAKASMLNWDNANEMTNKITIEQDGPLEIQLSDKAGQLLRNSQVTLQGKTVTTDENGIAYFEDVAAGISVIKVQLPRFGGKIERHVTVEPEGNAQVPLAIATRNNLYTSENSSVPRITVYSTDWGDYDVYWDMYWYTSGTPVTGTPGGSVVVASAYAVNLYDVWSGNLPTGWTISCGGSDVNCSIPSNAQEGLYVFDIDISSSDGNKTIEVGVLIGDGNITLYVEVIDDDYYDPIIGAEVSGDLGTYSGDYASGYTEENGYAVFHGLDIYDSAGRWITATHPEYLTAEEVYYPTQDYVQYLTMYTYPTAPRGNISLIVSSAFNPIKNCKISITGTRYSGTKKTDVNGRLTLENMAQDTYAIEATKAGFQSYSATITLNGDNLYAYTPIVLTPTTERTISIMAKRQNSNSIETGGFLIINGKRHNANEEGVIQINKVPPGTYRCYVGAKNLIGKKIRIDVSQENYSNTIYLPTENSQEPTSILSDYYGRISCSPSDLYVQTSLDQTIARGYNSYGQLGTGNTSTVNTWKVIADNTVRVAAGKKHSLILKSDGTVWASGNNDNGELGNGTTTDSKTYVQVNGLTDVVSIAAGDGFSLALKSDGTVWSWGINTYGQLGNNTTTKSSIPVQVLNLTSVTQIQAGDYHGLALKSDGTVWSWGNNNYGQLGIENVASCQSPVQVTGILDVVQISASENANLCVSEYGTVWGWGSNTYGRLCNGTKTTTNIPEMSPFFTDVKQVAIGTSHCLILKKNGSIWSMERVQDNVDSSGQLSLCYQPVQIKKVSGIVAIACNDYGNLALKNDGTIITWGVKKTYQFGVGQEYIITQGSRGTISGYFGNISNTSMELARDISREINNNELIEEGITQNEQHRYYTFVASDTASYMFTTTGTGDTYGYLRDEDGTLLASNNNISSSNYNFMIQKSLEKGKSYYLEIKANSATDTFDYTLSAICQKTIAGISVQQTVNKPLYTALKRSEKTLDSDNDGIITADELQELTGSLILSGYNITDLSGLQSCTSIETLYLDNNNITNLEPISVLHQLKYLNISHNKIANLDSLYGLSELATLVANDNNITQINGIVTMRDLTRIYLDRNQISSVTPLATATNVTHLSIADNNIESIQAIGNMGALEYLNLNNNQITELSAIKDLAHLRELRLSNNKISDISKLPDCRYYVIAIDGNLFDIEENQACIDDIDAKIKIYQTNE